MLVCVQMRMDLLERIDWAFRYLGVWLAGRYERKTLRGSFSPKGGVNFWGTSGRKVIEEIERGSGCMRHRDEELQT
jgi:hypothetical protein